MTQNHPQPALSRTWTPFWGPIERLGERGIVLYLQGRDYKAEDARALLDLLRFVPQGCQERVRFVPMQANLQMSLHLRDIQHAMRALPKGISMKDWSKQARPADKLIRAAISRDGEYASQGRDWDTFWKCACAFAAELTAKAVPVHPPVASQVQLGLADAENLLIVGRPEYYSAWWSEKRLVRELVCRAGYPSRYIFPDRGERLEVAQPIGKALFDRKWLLEYGQIHAQGTGEEARKTSEPNLEHDYGLVLHSQMIYKGTRKKVTVCVGCQALGTWAATRFVADPALFRQLSESGKLEGDEFPLEILLRVKKEMPDPDGLVGMNDLTSGNIRILNNDPREYIGQIYDPPCDSCDPKCGAEAGGQSLRISNTERQRSDIGRSLRDLRTILMRKPNAKPLLDPIREAVLGGLPAINEIDPCGVWREADGVAPLPPPQWRNFCPRFTAEPDARTINVTLSHGLVLFDEMPIGDHSHGGKRAEHVGKMGSNGLIMGPRLFALLWEALSRLVQGRSDKAMPRRPILFLGGSGSGKDPLVNAVRHSWRYMLSKGNGPTAERVFPAEYPPPVNTAEIIGRDEKIADRLKDILSSFTKTEGSIFLDEFSDMSIPSQVSLLRLLQDGIVTKDGAPAGRHTPEPDRHRALIVAATSQPLEAMAKAGTFREDLLFRFWRFKLPDLAERPLDALAILTFELASADSPTMTLAALKLYLADPFEGNVRTLRKETIPRIRDVWRSLAKRKSSGPQPVLQIEHMAEALKLRKVSAGKPDEQLFDDPHKTRVRLLVGRGKDRQYQLRELVDTVVRSSAHRRTRA